MKVYAVDNNNKRRTCLIPMAEGGIIGGAVGLVSKYAKSVTSDEKNTPEYKDTMAEIESKRTRYSNWTKDFIDSISKNNEKSVARDLFISSYYKMNDGDELPYSKFDEIEKSLGNNIKERDSFKVLVKKYQNYLDSRASKNIKAYNHFTKFIRPTGFFIGAGAVVGAFIALVNEILKTEVKN